MKKIFLILLLFTLPMVAGAEDTEGLRWSYKAGEGLKVGDGTNFIAVQGRVQARFSYSAFENAIDDDTWAIQRGKLKLDGHVLDKLLRFGFQTNLATRANANTTGNAILEDYFVDWVPESYFGLRVGQYKVPFLMQELTSSGRQQFVDRSLTTGFFNLARDIGATLHGDIGSYGMNYSVFMMNGDGINTLNRNRGQMVGMRWEWPILGSYQPSESDTDFSPERNLGIGVAYAYNEAVGAVQNNTIPARTKAHHGTFDLGYKYKGFSLQGAGMVTRTHNSVITNSGYNAQIGYFFVPKKFEVALRADGTVFDTAVNQYEYAAALNYFIQGHGIKFQTDYSLIQNNRGANLNDHRVRTQMQMVF